MVAYTGGYHVWSLYATIGYRYHVWSLYDQQERGVSLLTLNEYVVGCGVVCALSRV